MDVRQMNFPNNTFDAVIDKGLLDAVVCSDGAKQNVDSMMTEIYRVLKPNGVYICVSHGGITTRKKYLKNLKKFNWERTQELIPKPCGNTEFHGMKGMPKCHCSFCTGNWGKVTAIPKDDEQQIEAKKHFHFIYTCKKTKDEIVDSDDPDAVKAFEAKKEEEEKKRLALE